MPSGHDDPLLDEADVDERVAQAEADAGPGGERAERQGDDADGPGRPAPIAAAEERAVLEEEVALRNQLLRLAAEFDNYRKRESRERLEAWSRAKADLVEKLLPALDDLSRVAHPEGAEGRAESAVEGLLAGVGLVERKLLQTLEKEGLERVRAEGAPFDPAQHEAILTQPTAEPELDGLVAHVATPGYRFGDRLVRPAKVVVWKLRR